MTTLDTFGVQEDSLSFIEPLTVLNPRCELIQECQCWDDVEPILESLKNNRPGVHVWIGYDRDKGVHQIGVEI